MGSRGSFSAPGGVTAYDDLTGKPTLGTAAALAVDTDSTFAADSDARVPSQKAVAAAIDAIPGGGSGDVVGPASAVNNRVVFFDGTTGKLVKDSGLALSGSNTGDQTSVSGNAGTATALATPRAINGVNFDGTAPITVTAAAATLTGLGAGVADFLGTPSSDNLRAALTDETGSGAAVFADTPTLVTPVLGVASATSINKVAITAPATFATLTIADGVTLTVNANATISGSPPSLGANTFTAQQTVALGTITSDAQTFSGTATWNASGVTFNAFLLNVTATASAAASLLMDLQVGGTSQFKVKKDGVTTFGNTLLLTPLSGFMYLGVVGGSTYGRWSTAGVQTISGGLFAFAVGADGGGSADTALGRNAAGVVEVNSGAAGTLRDLKLRNVVGQSGYTEMVEMTAPGNGAANTARLYAEDSAGKTRLMVIFPSGAAAQLAIEP